MKVSDNKRFLEFESTSIESFDGKGIRKFKPSTSGRGNDWVLLMDDAEKSYSAPDK